MAKQRNGWLGVVFILALGAGAAWVAISDWRPLKLGLDLQGGAHLVYRADVSAIPGDEQPSALGGVRDVIERRVNTFGVAEPLVQTNQVGNEQRIIVELAGVFDVNDAIARIGETPQLDFREESEIPDDVIAELNIENQDQADSTFFATTGLTGAQLRRATVNFDQVSGTPSVALEFDGEGKDLFAEITERNIGKRLAIYLDEVPISAPVVQQEITNGEAVISGGFTVEEAQALAQRLNAGALPVPIELIGQHTVGPSLGARSVQDSVRAGLLGLLIVVLWMIGYYRVPGLIAALSLALYVALFITLVKLIPVTLTLAGIAGLILSIGMAVDANVLIFERLRENIRVGKNIGYALEHGFTEAWSSIKASNVSSLITAAILYAFGTSIIRGFALTFSIGIVLSMVTAITVTRVLLGATITGRRRPAWWLLGARPDAKAVK